MFKKCVGLRWDLGASDRNFVLLYDELKINQTAPGRLRLAFGRSFLYLQK